MAESKHKTVRKLFALEAVLDSPDFGKADATVLAILIEYTSGIYGRAWPSIETIAEVGQIGRRTVQASLRRLETAGFVKTQRGGGRNRPSVYHVNLGHFERSPFSDRIKAAAKTRQRNAPFPKHKGCRPLRPLSHGSSHERAQSHAQKGANLCAKGRRILHPNPSEEPIRENPSVNTAPPDGDARLPNIQNEDRENVGKNLRLIGDWLGKNTNGVLTETDRRRIADCRDWCVGIAEEHDWPSGDGTGNKARRFAEDLHARLEAADRQANAAARLAANARTDR